MVGAGGVDAVLVTDDFPELGADLVAALSWKKDERLGTQSTWAQHKVDRLTTN